MTTARRKLWGWGFEDQQPSSEQIEQVARWRARASRLRAGRGRAAAAAGGGRAAAAADRAAGSLAEICSSDALRARRATPTARPTATSCARSAAAIDHPPDVVARPRDEREVEQVLAWCADAGAAAIPYGGGTSVVGGVEPRVPQAAAVTIDLGRLDRVLEVDAVSRAARIQAGATGPGPRGPAREHGLTLRHFPQSFEFSTLGGWIATRAGGHFATLHTHIDDFVESVRAITPSGVWESRRLPGSGAGPSPDRMLIGSEGILGVITEAWVRVQAAPRFKASAARAVRLVRAGRRGGARARPVAACIPSNCRLLDPGRGGADERGAGRRGAARARLRGPRPPGRPRWMAQALALCEEARRPRRARSAASPRAPGATPSCRRPTCATR